MPKTRKQKEADLDLLTQEIGQATVVIVTDYRGLGVMELNKIRQGLREKGATFNVAKNTLTAMALKANGHPAPEDLFSGPTALTLVGEDIPGATKALNQFVRDTKILAIKGAILGPTVLMGADVDQLQDMPTKDQSRAAIVGAVAGPLSGIVTVLNAPLREIAYVIQQRADQLGAPAATE